MEFKPTRPPSSPRTTVMRMATGAWVTKVISEVTQLGIPDIVQEHGPLSPSEIVAVGKIQAEPNALERVLRAAASVGVFTESKEGRFGLTPLSEVLTSDAPDSVKKLVEVIGDLWFRFFAEFSDAIKTGEPQVRKVLGADWWDHLKLHPDELERFEDAMTSNGWSAVRGVLKLCDFGSVGHIVDVGGGFGDLAVALLEQYPKMRATVLEVPDVIPVALKRSADEESTVGKRLSFVGGDMFDSVPGAEVYLLKHIIHDWDDSHCVRLLENCAGSLKPKGKVISIDAVLPEMGETGNTPAKLLDILMLVAFTGKERTQAQWEHLYRSAGLELTRIVPIPDHFASIIEGEGSTERVVSSDKSRY